MKGLLSNVTLTSATLPLALLLLSLSLVSSLLFVTSANAVSDYDNTVDIVTTLLLDNDQDIKNEWYQIIQESANCTSDQKGFLEDAIADPDNSDWGVSYIEGSNGVIPANQKGVNVYWSNNSAGYNQFGGASPDTYLQNITTGNRYEANIYYNTNLQTIRAECSVNASSVIATENSTAFGYKASIFFSTYPTTNPTGYEGPNVPASEPQELTIVRPQFKACIANRRLTITDKTTEVSTSIYKLHVVITQGTFETQTYFFEGDFDAQGQVIQDLPNDEPFAIQMFFYTPEGALLPDTDTIDYRETDITFSNTVASCQDTTNEETECDENDLCAVPTVDKYPDCTEHNWVVDLWGIPEMSIPSPATAACAVAVYWSMILDFVFGTIFTPFDLNDYGLANDNHGLTSIITAPLNIFQELADEDTDCITVDVPLPSGVGDLQLPCMTAFYTTVGGAFFTMYQTIASGAIAYYVGVRLFEMVKGFKEPNDDKIEVTAL